LTVPGLSEKRPSVLKGDRITVRRAGANENDPWFEGYVHGVKNREVGLRFNSKFSNIRGQKYEVHFQLNRIPLLRQHQALNVKFPLRRLLFPAKEDILARRTPNKAVIQRLTPYDRSIAANPPQWGAVASIVSLPKGSPPFIVFGPYVFLLCLRERY
jgi:helicase MOV-10